MSWRKNTYLNNTDKNGTVIPFKKNGRMMVTLENIEGISINFDLATLVAARFIENPNNYKFVKFLDNNPENCKSENLYWSETE